MDNGDMGSDPRPDLTSDVSDADIDAARERGRARLEAEPLAKAVSFDESTDRLVIDFVSDVRLEIPRTSIRELEHAAASHVAHVEIIGPGIGLSWPDLDLDLSVAGLARNAFGNRIKMAELARKGGSVRSEAKAEAARANGKKGGRRPSTA